MMPVVHVFFALGECIHEDIVREAFSAHVDKVEKFINFCRSTQEFAKDIPLQAVLQLILVFSANGDNLVNHRHLSNLQDQYLILLKHYLESKFSFSEGKQIYISLLQKLQAVKSISENIFEVIHQIDPEKFEPLMVEVFNVNCKK